MTNAKYAVKSSRFLLMAVIPTSLKLSNEAKCAAIPKIGALLNCQDSALWIGWKVLPILKRVSLLCPHQPANRGKSSLVTCFSCTNKPATPPGLEFKYL